MSHTSTKLSSLSSLLTQIRDLNNVDLRTATVSSSTADAMEYLMDTFTREIASKITRDLRLTYVSDIRYVSDRDIDGLDLINPHKRILKRVRNEVREKWFRTYGER